MKRDLTSARRGAFVRAFALCAATGMVACADADDTTQSDPLAQGGSVGLDGGVTVTSTRDGGGSDAGDAGTGAPTLTKASTLDGLAQPESAFFDEDSQAWYVSNQGATTPGDGFIAKLDAQGKLVARELIKGLNDPKGVAVHDGTLFATDGTKVVRVKLSAPGDVKTFDAPGARFLNDTAVDPETGIAYFSDLIANVIYKLDGDTVSELVRSPALESPNGLKVVDGTLYVAGFGAGLNPGTGATASKGRVLKLDLKTPTAENLKPVSDPIGTLDGLEPFGNGFLVTNYSAGVFYVDAQGKATQLTDLKTDALTSAADIGVSRDLLAVPDGRGSKIVFYTLSR